VPVRAQRGIDPGILRLQAQLGQPRGLDAARFPTVQVQVGAAAPETDGLTEGACGTFRVTQGEQLASLFQKVLESSGVDLIAVDRQPVSVGRRLDRAGAQCPPEPMDAAGHDLGPGRRWRRTPERVGQALDAGHSGSFHRRQETVKYAELIPRERRADRVVGSLGSTGRSGGVMVVRSAEMALVRAFIRAISG
jgi:hypothetical protein